MSSITPFELPGALPSQYDSQGFGNSGVVKASSAIFYGAVGTNVGNATLYVMFFNSATVPGNGAVPLLAPVPVPAGGTFSVGTSVSANPTLGPNLSNGLSWAASTTSGTLTQDATSSMWVTADYV